MPRQIAAVVAVLLAALVVGGALAPGHSHSAAARQASPAAGADCPATTPEENEALVRRYYEEAYNQRNTAVIDELLADDFVRHNIAVPQANQPSNADDGARVESWLAAFSDIAEPSI